MKIEINNIKVVGENILLEMHPVANEVINGIVIPNGTLVDARDNFQLRTGLEESVAGKVVAVGDGKKDKRGNITPFQVKIGDEVVIDKGSGVFLNRQQGLRLVTEDEILLVKDV